MSELAPPPEGPEHGLVGRVIGFCLRNKLIVALAVAALVGVGIFVAPFDWETGAWERSPVAVDAIPDLGENQQIVFTEWRGRSPQDVEDQVTYPLTTALLGLPGVRTIRSTSMFGFSSIYVIFKPGIDFYWSRSRLLEKLASLPAGALPEGVRPTPGPDATALGQVFWYTLEGRDPEGRPAGGWDPAELRRIQDWTVRYALMAAEGVAEVASVGGFVREYQVDVDPDALRAHGVTLPQVFEAVGRSNLDVGAGTIEMNGVEYFVRGVGFVEAIEDIEQAVVAERDGVPVLVEHVAHVALGPALRRGALDKAGAEAVGGVVVARYGANPLEAIKNTKRAIARLAPSLDEKVYVDFSKTTGAEVRAWAADRGFEAYAGGALDQAVWLKAIRALAPEDRPAWATLSKVTVVPFYDRTGLIYETLGTLETALAQEILITLVVVLIMLLNLRSSAVVGSMLPLAVLFCFILMRLFRVDANIVALSGIAIAIGTIVDMGIVVTENVLRRAEEAGEESVRLETVHAAASEVGGAVLTAVLTTVVSFLPVFLMTGPEGRMFRPLAFTKTFALVASIILALTVVPPLAHTLFGWRLSGRWMRRIVGGGLVAAGVALALLVAWWVGVIVGGAGLYFLLKDYLPTRGPRVVTVGAALLAAVVVGLVLASDWEPLGPARGTVRNVVFVGGLLGLVLGFFRFFQWVYPWVLGWCLRHKMPFLTLVAGVLVLGVLGWRGFDDVFGWLPRAAERVGLEGDSVRSTTFWYEGQHTFGGLGKEFMPPLDEGSFLLMPTTMVHASIGEALDVLAKQDRALASLPEVDTVVGKIGRVESALDPAPVSMIETLITYKSEYKTDAAGRRLTFRYDAARGEFVRDDQGRLAPDPGGRPYRQWRDAIRSPDDLWNEIQRVTRIAGTTGAPKLQPIAARLVMLQSGMRAPMGVKVKGPDLSTIEAVGLEIERFLKKAPGVDPATVLADRIVGKPYLEIVPDRAALARYGITVRAFQDVVEMAVGGRPVTATVEGRERYPVRVRYLRELRDRPALVRRVLIPAADGTRVPLAQVADIRYVRGPQAIKSEDTFKTGYVVFDKEPGRAEVDVVEACRAYLEAKREAGELTIPAGVTYEFAGTYEHQVRSGRTLALVLPAALVIIFLILYVQFQAVPTTLLVFTGIFVAWAGGFTLLWLYGRPWFLDFAVFGVEMRDLFQVHTVNLSVAVWVGFLALFGIATDDGVIMATYLDQSFRRREPTTVTEIRAATVAAGTHRVRACLMTTATTILALLPVLASTGRGSDVMVPMALPSVGGMAIEVLTMLVVPVLYASLKEFRLHTKVREGILGAGLVLTALTGFFLVAAYCAAHDLRSAARGRRVTE